MGDTMKGREIIEKLEKKYPVSAAESWDNPGLLVGDDESQVQRVYLTLDVTKEAICEAAAWKADMIISHHPMIFSPVNKINNHSFLGEKVLKLIQNGITCYAMHTNFDVCKMAEINADFLKLQDVKVLYVTERGNEKEEGIGRVGMLPERMTLGECAQYVKECYHLPQVKIFGDLKMQVEKVAVCGGSGKSMVQDALRGGAKVLITGDIDHHTGLDALDQGLAIIDAGHYGTEYFFMEQVKKDLAEINSALEVKCAEVKLPYEYR